jgi:hypothetical protein
MEKIGGLILEVQVFVARWNLLGVLGFVAAVGTWRRQQRISSQAYLSCENLRSNLN